MSRYGRLPTKQQCVHLIWIFIWINNLPIQSEDVAGSWETLLRLAQQAVSVAPAKG